jgi:putative ABC transport system permease protein
MDAIKGLIPASPPRIEGIRIDGGVLLVSLFITVGSGVMFGLGPALLTSRVDLLGNLKEGGISRPGGRRHNRFLHALVVGQLATAFVLANGAALLVVSYLNVVNIPRGFDSEQVLVARVSLNGPTYNEIHQRLAFWDRLIERIQALPGVEHAGVTNKLPLNGGNNGSVLVEGETFDPQVSRPLVEFSYVSPGYLHAMGISLLSGRGLEDRDRSAPDAAGDRFAVVNQALVDRYWLGESALGKRIRADGNRPEWTATVVGVVENVRQWGLEYPPIPEMYFHHSFELWSRMRLVVRAKGNPLALAPALRQAVLEIDHQIPLAGIHTMDAELRASTGGRRFNSLLASLFAVTALILAGAGTYGVMSYYVSQRTHEIGVRVALGANRNSILRLVLGRGMRLILLGMALGLAGALTSANLIAGMMFGSSPSHPLFLIGVALFMTLVAVAAIAMPVFRAMRVDPLQALRAE